MSFCLSICQSLSLPLCLAVCPSASLCVRLSVCLPFCLLPNFLSVCLSLHLCLSLALPASLSVTVCSSVCVTHIQCICAVPPTIAMEGPWKMRVIKGEEVKLECKASGVPKPRIAWQKGTKVLGHSPGESFHSTTSLERIVEV